MAVHTGRHPPVMNPASGVVICTLGKDDYMQLKAYCPISLLSSLGKVLEKVVTEVLLDHGDRRGLLSEGQSRSRRGQSSMNTVGILVDTSPAARKNGHVTGVLLTNIIAAFPCIANGRLVNIMKDREMDGDLKQWTESFLSERMV